MALLFSIHEHEAIVCGGTANGGVVQLWVRWNGKPSIWEGGTSFHCLGERLGDCDLSPLHSGVSWRVSAPHSLSTVSLEIPTTLLSGSILDGATPEPHKEMDYGESSQSQC